MNCRNNKSIPKIHSACQNPIHLFIIQQTRRNCSVKLTQVWSAQIFQNMSNLQFILDVCTCGSKAKSIEIENIKETFEDLVVERPRESRWSQAGCCCLLRLILWWPPATSRSNSTRVFTTFLQGVSVSSLQIAELSSVEINTIYSNLKEQKSWTGRNLKKNC